MDTEARCRQSLKPVTAGVQRVADGRVPVTGHGAGREEGNIWVRHPEEMVPAHARRSASSLGTVTEVLRVSRADRLARKKYMVVGS